jgi:tetratricopeptide (TPR) repeat protein
MQDGRDAATIANGKQAAAKALALDEELAEAHAAVASYAALEWNWDEADREFRRAIEINPDWAQGHLMYSMMYLVPNGRMREAIGEALRARDLDPLTRITRSMLAAVLYLNRDYARAIAESEDLRKSPSGPPLGDPSYLLSLALSGKAKRALADVGPLISSAGDDPRSLSLYGYLAAKTGLRKEAESILRRLTERSRTTYVSPICPAFVSIGLGDKGEALRHLRAVVANHAPEAPQIGVNPVFDPLHGDPGFDQLIRQMGLTPAY